MQQQQRTRCLPATLPQQNLADGVNTCDKMGYFDNAFFPSVENGELPVVPFLEACRCIPKFFGKHLQFNECGVA
jgi:hypothetical protein